MTRLARLVLTWTLFGGCRAPEPAPAPEAVHAPAPAQPWNTTCPKSGRPVDAGSFFEHQGRRVYFCNPQCAADGAQAPEFWLNLVYGN